MGKAGKTAVALTAALVGVLFIALKGEVVRVSMTLVGAVLVAFAIVELTMKDFPKAALHAVFGVLLIVFGWTIASAVLYVFSAVMLLFGVLLLFDRIRRGAPCPFFEALRYFAEPALLILTALFLLFNQGGTVDWVFVVSGSCLVLCSVVFSIGCFKKYG